MARSAAEVKVTFTGDTTDLEKKLDKLEKDVAGTSREIDAIGGSSDQAGSRLQSFSDKALGAATVVFGLAAAVGGTTQVMDGLSSGSIPEVINGVVNLGVGIAGLITSLSEETIAKISDTAASVAHTVATAAMTAAQWALNVAMEANPIVLVVAAIALLAVAFYEAYQHIGWFHDAVDKAWQILQGIFGWVQDHWKLILELLAGPIGLAVKLIIDHFDTIKNMFADVYGFFVMVGDKIYDAIKGPFERAFAFVQNVYDHTIKPIISALTDFGGLFGGDINKIADAEIVKRAKAAGKTDAEISAALAGRASGGPVMAGQSYVVGERGPEVLTMGGNGFITPNGGGGGQTVVLNIDGRSFMTWFVDASRDAGGIPITVRSPS